MIDFILDCSVTMTWCFADENNDMADRVMTNLAAEVLTHRALVPALWYLEVTNALRVAEKRKRLTEAKSLHFLDLLSSLPIQSEIMYYPPKDILTLARAYDLSAYDASYLLLALKLDLPLATLDIKLKNAAIRAHIPLFDVDVYSTV